MGLTTSELNVKIKADTGSLTSGAAKAKDSLKQFKDSADKASTSTKSLEASAVAAAAKMAAIATAAIAAAKKISGAVKECIDLGSDLAETQNVVDVAYGAMASRINDWSKTMIESFGLSETSAKKFSSTFMNMGTSIGVASDEAFEMSKKLTELAADMASFYNAKTEDTFRALEGIFTGSTESLKQYGIIVSEATINQNLLASGIERTYQDLSEAEKVAARYNVVMQSTVNAQGDFARNTNSWANQTRILDEQWNAVKTTIGQIAIKYLQPLIELTNKWLGNLLSGLEVISEYLGVDTSDVTTELSFGDLGDQGYAMAEGFDAADESVIDTTRSVQALKRSLLGFDELNRLSDFTSGTTGTSGGGVSASFKKTVAASSTGKIGLPSVGDTIDALQGLVEWTAKVKDNPQIRTLASSFETLWQKIDNKMHLNTVISTYSQVFGSFNTVFQPARTAIDDMKRSIGEFFGDAFAPLKKRFAESSLGQYLEELAGKVSSYYEPKLETLRSSIRKLFGITEEQDPAKTEEVTARTGSAFQKLGSTISSLFTPKVNEARSAIVNLYAQTNTTPSTSGFQSYVNSLKSTLQGLYDKFAESSRTVNGFKTNMNTLSSIATTYSPTNPLIPKAYASGGYPDQGSLFVAGEAGPEFVGNVGGQTGVWNSDQLISGIYSAMKRALSDAGINATINLDGNAVYSSVVKNNNRLYRSTGRSELLV